MAQPKATAQLPSPLRAVGESQPNLLLFARCFGEGRQSPVLFFWHDSPLWIGYSSPKA